MPSVTSTTKWKRQASQHITRVFCKVHLQFWVWSLRKHLPQMPLNRTVDRKNTNLQMSASDYHALEIFKTTVYLCLVECMVQCMVNIVRHFA